MRDILNDLEQAMRLEDPAELARRHARRPLPKRFYAQVTVAAVTGGSHAVHLDGRTVRTPGKKQLALPWPAVAEMIALEFRSQSETIDPVTMPVLRLANTAIDGIEPRTEAVLADLERFAASDLICYRAEEPEGLVSSQAAAWDPVLAWAESALGARFLVGAGIRYVDQPPEAIGAVSAALRRHREPLALAAIHSMTTLTGSVLLALAVAEGALDVEQAWKAAHVDEDWNIGQWGTDSEAEARRHHRHGEMKAAAGVLAAIAGS